MWTVVVALLAFGATEARAEEMLAPTAHTALERLQASSGHGLTTVVRENRISWADGIAEPALSRVPRVAARSFLERFGEAFGVGAEAELEPASTIDYNGSTFVRFRALHAGIPLIGGQVVVGMRDGLVRQISSGMSRFVTASRPVATVSATEAAEAVEAVSGRAAAIPGREGLAWLPLSGHPRQLLLVWVVAQRTANPPQDLRYLVDAESGRVLWRQDQNLHAEGLVYDPNPFETDDTVSRVVLPGLAEGATELEGEYARSFRCIAQTGDCSWSGTDCRTCGDHAHTAIADEEGNFLYEPEEPAFDDPFSEVQGYYHVSVINQFFEDTLGFTYSCGGSKTMNIYVNQHYPGDPQSSANAFFGDSDGDGCGDITMGEGMGVDFAYDADVIYHEFTHSVVETAGGLGCAPFGVCTDELGMSYVSIGLNEGFADYFAVTFTDDPELGEHAGEAFYDDPMIRNAENDHLCPFDMIGESHYDGQILVATGWEIRQLLGAEITDRIMMTALLAVEQSASYADIAAAIHAAAETELEEGNITDEDLAEVERIMGPEGRGITDCRRIVPLDEVPEGHHEEYMMLYTFMGMSFPSPLQWSLTAPRRAEELRFGVETSFDSPPAGSLRAHVRVGEPVGIEIASGGGGMGFTVNYEDDFVVDIRSDDLVIALDDEENPLQPGEVYYFAFEFQCNSGCLLRAHGDVEVAPNTDPIAVAGEDITVTEGDTVELDGSASNDPDGGELTFLWSLLDGPEVTFEGAETSALSFVAEEAGTYEIELTVRDEDGAPAMDTLIVTAEPLDDGDSTDDPDGGDEVDGGSFGAGGGGCDCAAASSNARAGSSLLLATLALLGMAALRRR